MAAPRRIERRGGDAPAPAEPPREPELEDTFEASVDKGDERLHRTFRSLAATGLVGGADVALGVGVLLLVKHASHSDVASSLAFSVGFIALTLARSELFTENFLLPLVAVAAGRDRIRSVFRMWAVVGAANLVGGWLVMGLFTLGFPELRSSALDVATRYTRLGIGRQSLAIAVLGGATITLMTWMQQRSDTDGPRIVAAVVAAFVLAIGALNHAVVASLEMFAGLQYGAPYGYAAWLGMLAWATFGNIIGGSGLVTLLRLMQVGPEKLKQERAATRRRGHRNR